MLLKINGRTKFFNVVTEVTLVKPGSYRVTTSRGDVYEVGGGRDSGGAHNEWFFNGPHYAGTVFCTSLVEACKMIDNT